MQELPVAFNTLPIVNNNIYFLVSILSQNWKKYLQIIYNQVFNSMDEYDAGCFQLQIKIFNRLSTCKIYSHVCPPGWTETRS